MKTYAIVYGWGCGDWHVKKFAIALKELGLKSAQTSRADIIIAHSLGCFRLPHTVNASTVVLIGTPYWPERPIITRWVRNSRVETRNAIRRFGYMYMLQKLMWSIYYALTRPVESAIALQTLDLETLLNSLRNKKVLLIRNQGDEYCSPAILAVGKKYKNVKLVQMPGTHDNYYTNPQPYVDLLKKEL